MRIFQVDAFTRSRFTGNPATVVLDAQGRDDALLRDVAREFAHAEVVFALPPTDPGHDLWLRFFNTRKEAPFVGHATVAAHAVLLELGLREIGLCRQRSGTGTLEVLASRETATGPARIEFRQSVPELAAPLPLKTTLRVAEALGLPGARLHDDLPARVARKGGSRLLVPVADPQALDGLAPQSDSLLALGRELDVDGFFTFSFLHDGAGPCTESRMFCPALGIAEDPVSGNAHAMLATYLLDAGLLPRGPSRFVGHQGMQLGRPGRVDVSLEFEGSRHTAVRIAGEAVIVSEGRLAE